MSDMSKKKIKSKQKSIIAKNTIRNDNPISNSINPIIYIWNQIKSITLKDIILITIAFVLGYLFNDSIKKEDFDKYSRFSSENDKIIISQLLELNQKIEYKDTLDIPLPGIDIAMLVKLIRTDENRKQFVYDKGESLDKNRISVYLDELNNLCFRIINKYSETFTIKFTYNEYPELFSKPLFLFFEYGKSENLSYMKMFINEKVVLKQINKYSLNFEYEKLLLNDPEKKIMLDIPQNEKHSIGTDLEKKYGGNFVLYNLGVTNNTLSSVDKRNYLNVVNKFVTRILSLPNRIEQKIFFNMFLNGKKVEA